MLPLTTTEQIEAWIKTNHNILLIICISNTNSIAYPAVGHYYNSPMRSRHMRKGIPFIWKSWILLRLKQHPSSTGTLAGLLQVPMACQTSWSKKACNSLVKSRFPLKQDQRISQDTLHLTKLNLDPSISLRSCLLTSSWRSLLDYLKPRRKTVQHCSAWWASVFRTSVLRSGPLLWENNDLTICTSQRKNSTSALGTTSRQLPG